MADKDKLRFLTGQEANLKDKALTRGQVYFAINSDTDSGKIYFDAPIDKNTTKRILMSSDHAKTADKATAADRATTDSNGRKFTETYVSELKLDNAGTTILYKYPDITTWKELKPKFLPLTGGTITGELYADSITAGDLLVNGSARFVNTILGNIETADKWKTARGFQIADSDAAHTSVSVNVNGSGNVVLKLPSTIKAALQGNADTATKATNDSNNKKITDEYLHRVSNTSSTLNQFSGAPKYLLGIESFTDGGEVKWQSVDSVKVGSASGADKWNTAVNFQVSDSDAAHTGTAVSVNGSKAIVLPLPATIKATLEGNASSANKVNHKYTLTLGKTKQTAFDGSADVSITITPESIGALSKDEASAGAAKWSTARMFYVADADASNTGTGVSVDGSKDITLKLPSTIKGNLKGNADTATTATNADKLDGYHRAGLYSSPGEWITANGYTKTITVNGNTDTYYPVVISTTTEKSALNYISVWKNLGTKTATYPDNHSNGTSSMWLIYEGRNWYWDGNGGYLKCWYYSMPYATLCAKAEQASNGVGALVVYLRGGGTEYNISTTYNSTVTVYYEMTNLGNTTHPVNVTPTTKVENRGQLSSTYLGYGNVPSADVWKTARNFAITDNDASHTGPTVSVNGSTSVTLQLPSAIKASITGHASEDLPLAGGTMTGNISYKGSKATNSMIRFLNNTTDTSGNGISIGGGGVTVIGAGESSQNLTPAANEESLYLMSDGSIKFYTYCDTIGNKRGVILDTSRNFYPDVNNSGSIGTSSNKWNSMYATTFYGALSGTASNATSDIRGNAIINTYLTNVYAKSDDSSYLYKQVGPASERSAELIGRYTPLDSDGLINMKYIPAAALERVVVVANQTAQYALTTANVQLGDVVKRNDTGQLYFVVDTNNLGNAGGYLQFTAGTAANVNWSGILNRPNIVGSASTKDIITLNDAKTVFTINRVNGDGTSDNYTLSPSFLPLAGGTITGKLSVNGETTLANLIVNGDARFVNTIQGSISGNAGTATKWATAKAFYIADAEAKHTSSPQVNIDGSQSSYTLKLPSTIKATLEGNADTATKLTNLTEADKASSTNTWRRVWFAYDDNVNGRPAYSDTFAYQTSTGTVKATKFQGALVGNADSASKWKTARSFITNLGSETSASVDGSTGPYNLGVTGTLPVSHGGTGVTTIAEIKAGKDADGNTITSKYVSIYNSNNIGSSADVTVNDLAKQGSAVGMINAATDNPFGKAGWVHVWSQAWNKTVNTSWVSQIALGVDESDGMWYRTKEGTIVGASWTRVIDSNNYNNYAVKKASSSTDNAIVRWDGTDGRRIQNSLLSISDEGLLTLQTGNHIGAKLGSAYITSANSSNGEILLQNGHLRFGSDSWDYNQWAGLKYVHSSKIIYLGLADGTIFNANSAQSGGTLALPGIRYFSINGKVAIDANDGWLRINEGKAFATGVYFGSNVVRTDGQFQVGDSGNKFYANSSGNGYFSNTLGIGGTNTSYKLYVNGTSYINGNTTVNGWLKVQNTTDSKNSQDSNASLAIQGGVSVAKQLSAKTIRIDGSGSDTTGSTTQGCTVHFNKTTNCIEFVFD